MAQGQTGNSGSRIVRLTPQAEDDRLIAYLDTEQLWGTEQADNYDAFLRDVMENLADLPGIGSKVENAPGVRRYFARWKSARNGHHIFYEETDNGILVLRILHSSMERPARFSEE